MAKINKSLIPGANQVLVHSPTYGSHLRAKRGSKSPADVNSAYKKFQEIRERSVPAAQLIRNELELYRSDFKGGQLWQDLLRIFIHQGQAQQDWHVSPLAKLDLWKNPYHMGRLLKYPLNPVIQIDRQSLSLELNLGLHPDFKRKFLDGYQLSMIAVFPDFERMSAESCIAHSPVISFDDPVETLSFTLRAPGPFKHYLVCMKLEGCAGGKVSGGPPVKGMEIIAAADGGS